MDRLALMATDMDMRISVRVSRMLTDATHRIRKALSASASYQSTELISRPSLHFTMTQAKCTTFQNPDHSQRCKQSFSTPAQSSSSSQPVSLAGGSVHPVPRHQTTTGMTTPLTRRCTSIFGAKFPDTSVLCSIWALAFRSSFSITVVSPPRASACCFSCLHVSETLRTC